MSIAHDLRCDELYSLLVPLNRSARSSPRLRGRGGPLRSLATDESCPWFRGHVAWNGRRVRDLFE